jgi:rfaE bifunctional protein kinase chain/domain
MLSSLNLDKLFSSFSKQKVLIIGDVMIDNYLWGRVKRISPEAPVPVISDIHEESRLGGAANVALNIKAMGAVPILCSVIGKDEAGKTFLELLSDENLSDIGIVMDEERTTTRKTRVISDKQQLLRIDEEITDDVSKDSMHKMEEIAIELIRKKTIDSVIFQDYDKGVITKDFIESIITESTKNKIPVLVDPKRINFLNYKNATLFKPNFKELKEGLKVDVDKYDLEGVASIMEEFRTINSQEIIMVTMSELGIIVNFENAYHHISAEVRDITDVSGAGDTVISIAALGLGAKLSALDTAILANLAGGQVCEKSGVVPVDKLQLLEEAKVLKEEEE